MDLSAIAWAFTLAGVFLLLFQQFSLAIFVSAVGLVLGTISMVCLVAT